MSVTLARLFGMFGDSAPSGGLRGHRRRRRGHRTVAGAEQQPPPGGVGLWIAGGGTAGFVSGVLFLHPRRFMGAGMALLGAAILVTPLSGPGGSPVGLTAELVKGGLAGILLGQGLLVLARSAASSRGAPPGAS